LRRAAWSETGFDILDDPSTPLEPGWARLRVEACGICGSDLHVWHGRSPRSIGVTPGHEFVGYLLDADASAPDVRYVASPIVTCGRCRHCLAGQSQRCPHRVIVGAARNGGIAEEVDVPVQNLVPVPEAASGVIAAITEPVAVAVRGLNLASVANDSKVLIAGGGTIGLITAILLRGRCSEVALMARHPHQLAIAEQFGASPIQESDLIERGGDFDPDIIIETIGGQADLSGMVSIARPGARIVMIGLLDEKPTNLRPLTVKEITLIGSFAYGAGLHGTEFGWAAELVGQHKSELSLLQTDQFSLADAAAAFEATEDKSRGLIKATIVV
jgi:threonine dehydrogenase-like Zn-dependent dehydrogenase